MSQPLVSVITGTFERPRMVAELIRNIRAQSYRPLEHCIVAEPSEDERINIELRAVIEAARADASDVPIKFVEVGRHWSRFLANSISAVPFQVAQWLSSGAYLCWGADDERFRPEHVEKLVALAEAEQADFVYPRMGCYWHGDLTRDLNWIGSPQPSRGQITHALFRADLLDYRGFMTHVGSGTDWDQIANWIDARARWAFLPEQTMTHRADKQGDNGEWRQRRPLRGHTPREASA
jgi:glycosyltransferase involved in cell wall biosynthesis